MPNPLNNATVSRPENLKTKILQFGEGNFLRAFVDWMIDKVNEKTDFNGSVKVVQPIPKGLVDLLNKQDGLYHVQLQGMKDGEPISSIELVKCVEGGMNPYEDYKGFLELGENPDLEFIVSNTTEAGIAFDENDTDYETIPNSFPAKLTALLHHRYKHFDGASDKAPVIIPCELIDKNGDNLKKYVLQYADLWETEAAFKDWINNDITFCNTLVDRIVPGFPKDNLEEIHAEIGYDDQLVVNGEFFHLWVIEGPESIQQKLPFDKAGLNVKFVDDLSVYRTRKVRILNGLHTSMVPVGYLAGARTVKEAMDHEQVGPYLEKELFEEIIPSLDMDMSVEELESFAKDILERFENPYIKHELSAIALNSVSKYKVRVLPSLLQYHAQKGEIPKRLTFALAALIRFYKGSWEGEDTPINDGEDVVSFVQKAWESGDHSKVAQTVLSHTAFWDQDLTEIDGLNDMVTNYLQLIDEKGVNSTLSEDVQ
ncbi:tagaturonate reductase [Gracilimonas mengyeensis]|uniref:Tagaturonate reductase n=1 Tax=Gracilimonas mengyeensis TaxID=1302730 RepID=A0A521C2U0_9BACT|nr:tagaturonate reductase [Gracilimonas mengyeensis]SMO53131.1 tagaturonate reductase [Gracilimonas mengyeensis]